MSLFFVTLREMGFFFFFLFLALVFWDTNGHAQHTHTRTHTLLASILGKKRNGLHLGMGAEGGGWLFCLDFVALAMETKYIDMIRKSGTCIFYKNKSAGNE